MILTPENEKICKERTKRFEDFRLKPYLDSKKIWTGGWGHRIYTDNNHPINQNASFYNKAYWEEIFEQDFENVCDELDRYFSHLIELLTQTRRIVIVDMCFNMGIDNLREFGGMWSSITTHKLKAAAREILNSDYALDVGYRAMDNARAMWRDEF